MPLAHQQFNPGLISDVHASACSYKPFFAAPDSGAIRLAFRLPVLWNTPVLLFSGTASGHRPHIPALLLRLLPAWFYAADLPGSPTDIRAFDVPDPDWSSCSSCPPSLGMFLRDLRWIRHRSSMCLHFNNEANMEVSVVGARNGNRPADRIFDLDCSGGGHHGTIAQEHLVPEYLSAPMRERAGDWCRHLETSHR